MGIRVNFFSDSLPFWIRANQFFDDTRYTWETSIRVGVLSLNIMISEGVPAGRLVIIGRQMGIRAAFFSSLCLLSPHKLVLWRDPIHAKTKYVLRAIFWVIACLSWSKLNARSNSDVTGTLRNDERAGFCWHHHRYLFCVFLIVLVCHGSVRMCGFLAHTELQHLFATRLSQAFHPEGSMCYEPGMWNFHVHVCPAVIE